MVPLTMPSVLTCILSVYRRNPPSLVRDCLIVCTTTRPTYAFKARSAVLTHMGASKHVLMLVKVSLLHLVYQLPYPPPANERLPILSFISDAPLLLRTHSQTHALLSSSGLITST